MSLVKTVASLLPERVKEVIRPWFRPARPGAADRSSGLSIASFGGFEVAYRRGTADEEVIKHSFENDIFFPGVPEYLPSEGDVIIDVGAHIGTFSLLASSKVPHGRVHAIEASEDTCNLLRINVALNRAANVAVHRLALSDRDGTCALHHDAGNWGHSTVKRLSRSSETVPCLSLSSFLREQGIAECHFMKMNCEGAEFPILLGTPRSVLRTIGTILALYHCDLWSADTETDLISHLESCGYACVIRKRSRDRGWIIATRSPVN